METDSNSSQKVKISRVRHWWYSVQSSKRDKGFKLLRRNGSWMILFFLESV